MIFVDEAGFTGNDLLNAEQPYFVLSSVSISEEEAGTIIQQTRDKFRISAEELKARKLLRSARGRDAVKYIIYNLQGRYALSCNHKSYNLCCKFFEYVFEPVLKDSNILFYRNNFHLFIANTLFLFFQSEDRAASDIIVSFARMMREKNFDALRRLFSPDERSNHLNDIFAQMVDFMEGYADVINEELEILNIMDDRGKWILDLSISSLYSVLRHWSQSHDELTVICDPSKPLADLVPRLDVMIGRSDRPIIRFPGREAYSPIFNLKERVSFQESHLSSGIQLADILASTSVYAIKENDTELLPMVDDGKIYESVFPTPENVDLSKKQPFLNGIVLHELAERARGGLDPLRYMEEYYELINEQYDISPPPSGRNESAG